MSLRIVIISVVAFGGAAIAVTACEPAPTVCAPKIEGQGMGPAPDPACTECVDQHCRDAGPSCDDACKEYGACTCDCDEEDTACFEACAMNRSESCGSCQQEAGNAVIACIMNECQVCAGGGGSGSASASAESSFTGDDGSSWSTDDGASSWTGDDGGSWSTDGGSSWTSTDDGASSWTSTDDGAGGPSCDQLHAQCCPNLDGIDLELCNDANDEDSCALWLDIFAGEGKC